MYQTTFPQVPGSHMGHYIREKIKRPYRTAYRIDEGERQLIMKECGPMGLLIMELFVEICSWDKPPARITDKDIARHFGIAEVTAKKHRLRLFKKGFLHRDYAKTTSGVRTHTYYVGKAAVREFKGDS